MYIADESSWPAINACISCENSKITPKNLLTVFVKAVDTCLLERHRNLKQQLQNTLKLMAGNTMLYLKCFHYFMTWVIFDTVPMLLAGCPGSPDFHPPQTENGERDGVVSKLPEEVET